MDITGLNYQILMLDLDGTLVQKHNKIDPQVGKLLQVFVKLGGHVVFNTGRCLKSALKVQTKLMHLYQVPVSLIACFNGALLYDCWKQQIVCQKPIEPRLINPLIQSLQDTKIKLGLYHGIESQKTSLVLGNMTNKQVKRLNGLSKKFHYQCYDPNQSYNEVYKILGLSSLNKFKAKKWDSQIRQIIANFNQPTPLINIARPWSFLYEMTNINATKGLIIPDIIACFHTHGYCYTQMDICAIGDSENDLPMFGDNPLHKPIVGLALALGLKLHPDHEISNHANKVLKKPHLLAKFMKKFVFNYN